MKSIVLAVALLLLGGCAATTRTGGDDPNSSYFLISHGGASGISRIISGGVEYCKITQKNLGTTDFDVSVTYEDGKCKVEALSSDKDS